MIETIETLSVRSISSRGIEHLQSTNRKNDRNADLLFRWELQFPHRMKRCEQCCEVSCYSQTSLNEVEYWSV